MPSTGYLCCHLCWRLCTYTFMAGSNAAAHSFCLAVNPLSLWMGVVRKLERSCGSCCTACQPACTASTCSRLRAGQAGGGGGHGEVRAPACQSAVQGSFTTQKYEGMPSSIYGPPQPARQPSPPLSAHLSSGLIALRATASAAATGSGAVQSASISCIASPPFASLSMGL